MPNKILFAGDSLVQGFGVMEEDNWVSLVQKALPNVEIVNIGRNGLLSEQVLEKIQKELEYEMYDCVAVLCGANDFIEGYSPEYVSSIYNQILDSIEEKGGKGILLIPPVPSFDTEYPFVSISYYKSLIEYTKKLMEIEKDRGILLEKGFLGDSNLYIDGIHPTEEGHKNIAKLFLEYLEKEQNK